MKKRFLLTLLVITISIIVFGTISVSAAETVNVSTVSALQSAHPYSNNTEKTWIYTHSTSVESLEITFSSDTETESNYDWIYVFDGNGNQIEKQSGTTLAGKTITVPGNVVKIKLTSDGSVQKNGFTVTNIKANGSQPFTTIANGTCGANLKWALDTYGILTISGYGNMYDWDWYTKKAPWYHLSDKISEVVIEDGVENIGNYAFYECSSIIDVTIPSSVSYIGFWSFGNCKNLASITIPEGVTKIGRCSFSECTKLTSVTIPSTITSIESSAFYFCTGLKQVNITNLSAWCNISFAGNLSNPLRYANKLYLNGNLVNDLVIPDTITHIGDYSFYGCSINSLSIPESVTSIGESAFYYATFTNIDMGKNVKTIGKHAFEWCSSLQTVTLPDGLTDIKDSAFYQCRQLKSITIPNSITSISNSVFYACVQLESITIPNTVTSIGDSAFSACVNLSTVNYIGSPKQWNDIALGSNNTYLTNATINYIYNRLLEYITYVITDYNDVKITDCDTDISGDITIPSTIEGYPVTMIDYYAFKGCDKITSVVFPESVTDIYGSAFENCTALSSITFTDNVKWIGGSAFGNCTSLTSVTLPAGLSAIGDRAFYGCTNLTSIEIDENNSEFCSIDGNLFDKNVTTMLQYSIGKSESAYIIPDGVTMIDTYCFEDCVNLSSITLPESIQEIMMTAFRDCPNIKNVYYYGTPDEWNEVLIGTNNDGLTGATIHFIYPRTETVLSNNDKTFTITPINIATGNMVILALYNGTALVEMQSLVYTGEPIPFTTTKEYANAKVFVWENFETLVPICEAEIIK